MKRFFVLALFLVSVLASSALAVTSPIPNSGFETGDLGGWETGCGGRPSSACSGWYAEVGEAYAYDGEYGLRFGNPSKYHWSTAKVYPVSRFEDDSNTYTVPMKLIRVGHYYGSIMILIGDSQGYVRYRGSRSTNIAGCPPDIPFKMELNQWKEYTFNFRDDYYKKYGRYPDTDRRLILYSAQDYWAGGSEFWVDNVLGEPKAPCTDADGDGYSVEGGECGLIDCDDNDAEQYPGTTKVTDDNFPWDSIGECRVEISECDGTRGEYIIAQEKIEPTFETCDMLDNDCNGIADDIDEDGDGVYECGDDFCLGSVPDEIELNPNQYAQNDEDLKFETGPGNDDSIVYDMAATKGCTCVQIADALGLGKGQVKKGCAPGEMEEWTGISAEPDREAGLGMNVPKGKSKVTGRAVGELSETTWLGLVSLVSVLALAAVCLMLLKNALKK